MHHRKKRLVAGLVLILLLAGGWYYFHGKNEEKGAEAHGGRGGKGATAPVGVQPVKKGDIDLYIDALGNVTPRNTVTVHSRVDGQLMRIDYKEGQMVAENALLAELDARPFEAQVEQAEGQMKRDEALLAEAKLDLKRYQTLFTQDSIARQQVDTQASLVKQYEGAVKNDQGLIDTAKLQVLYTKITSPVSGRVGLRQVDVGNIVHAADANGVVVVTTLQPITVLFTVAEDSIPNVTRHNTGGTPLSVEAWDRDSKTKLATGALTALDNVIDPTTGSVKLRAEFANKDNALFPSQFVNVKLKLGTVHDAMLIPSASVQRGTQGAFVYVVGDDNVVQVHPVTLGAADGDNVQAVKGVEVGERVVTDGADGLKQGAKAEIAGEKPKDGDKAGLDDASNGKHHKHPKSDADAQ